MRRPLLAVVRFGLWSASGSTLLAAPTASGAAPPAWLSWSAPPECRNGQEVERRLELLLDREVNFADVPATHVKMDWSEERGWAVRVRVTLSEGARDRKLSAPTCAEAYDLVALSLALILDPDFRGGAEGGGALGAEEPAGAEPSAEEDDTGSARASALGVDAQAGSESLVESERGAPSTSLAPAPESSGGPGAADAGDAEAGFETARVLSAAAAGRVDMSIFPVPEFGGAVQAALDWGALRAELSGVLLASESTLLEQARFPVRFSSLLGELDLCRMFRLGARLSWATCGGAELGSLSASELGGQGRRVRAAWFAAALGTGPEFLATEGLRAFARARAVIPVLRHDLVLAGGGRVHEFPPVSLQLEVGVRVDLTDFGGGRH